MGSVGACLWEGNGSCRAVNAPHPGPLPTTRCEGDKQQTDGETGDTGFSSTSVSAANRRLFASPNRRPILGEPTVGRVLLLHTAGPASSATRSHLSRSTRARVYYARCYRSARITVNRVVFANAQPTIHEFSGGALLPAARKFALAASLRDWPDNTGNR